MLDLAVPCNTSELLTSQRCPRHTDTADYTGTSSIKPRANYWQLSLRNWFDRSPIASTAIPFAQGGDVKHRLGGGG